VFHIFIDTNIWREDPTRKRAEFTALSRLAKKEIVEIHLPSIVDDEFKTQLQASYSEETLSIEREIDKLLKKISSEPIERDLTKIAEQIKAIEKTLTTNILSDYSEWKSANNVYVHEISERQARNAFRGYFTGSAPYSSIKQRKDIPDSFIYESCGDLSKKIGELYCICKDKNLSSALSNIENVKVFGSIGDFLQNSECKLILEKLDSIDRAFSDNRSKLLQAIRDHQVQFDKTVVEQARTLLHQYPLAPHTYIGDTGDAMIMTIHSLSIQDIDIENSNYLGDGQIEVPIYMNLDADTLYEYMGDIDQEEKINPKQDRSIFNEHRKGFYEVLERVNVIARSWFVFEFNSNLINNILINDVESYEFILHLDDIDEFEFID